MAVDPRRSIGANNGPPLDENEARQAHPYGADGWVAVARAMRFHPLVGCGNPVPPADAAKGHAWSRYEAWQDLIMECRYEAGRVNNGGRIMEIKPGQLIGAVSWLGHRWNWTPKTVRIFLDKLEAEGMLSSGASNYDGEQTNSEHGNQEGKHKGKQAKVLTICNYDIYQMWYRHQGQSSGQSSGQIKGKQGANEGQQYKENNLTKEQEDSPLTPQAGGLEPELPLADGGSRRGQKAAETRRQNEERKALLSQAFDLYNKAAEHWGFSRCEVLTESRGVLLAKRIDEIGGIENFRLALRAIGKDDFLAGRVQPRGGEAPFKLNIDRLLQTKGGLGDVLARLVELAGAPDRPASMNGKEWGWWRGNEDKLRALKPQFWRDLLDDVRPNGTWPWWILAAPPGHPECLVHPDVLVERGLVAIYQGNIEHV